MPARIALTAATLSIALAACVAEAGEPASSISAAQAEPVYVRHAMQAEVNPAIVAIWDVGNNAMNDSGGLDAAKMTPELWDGLAEAAARLAASGEKLASATDIRSAAPDNRETAEYEVSMADVQRFIDADPQGFRDEASRFAGMARVLEAAAVARDLDTASELVAGMDSECAACHTSYWYAEAG